MVDKLSMTSAPSAAPRSVLGASPHVSAPTTRFNHALDHDHDRLICRRICRPAAATAPYNTSATCPLVASGPPYTCSERVS